MARPIVLILHLLRLADAINFRKDYSPPLFRHLNPIGGWVAGGEVISEVADGQSGLQGGSMQGAGGRPGASCTEIRRRRMMIGTIF